jgi:hypothetical protein
MKNLIILIALVLFGCTQADQSQVDHIPFTTGQSLIQPGINATNYRDIPWWPVFEAQILPTLEEPITISVDESEFGYTVDYRGCDEYGRLFFACPDGLLYPHITIQQYTISYQ